MGVCGLLMPAFSCGWTRSTILFRSPRRLAYRGAVGQGRDERLVIVDCSYSFCSVGIALASDRDRARVTDESAMGTRDS